MATYSTFSRIGQVLEPRDTLKLARGGLAPREVIDVAVKPAGLPLESFIVITDTPEACLLNADRSASVGFFSTSKFSIAHRLVSASSLPNLQSLEAS